MKKIILPAKMENLDDFMNFVIDFSREAGFEKKIVGKIRLAFEEAVVNVIKYAYQDGNGDVEIQCSYTDNEQGIVLKLIDSGIEFNPLEKAEPDINLPAEERPIGGLGIFMIKKIMSDVLYQRKDGQNILILTKNK